MKKTFRMLIWLVGFTVAILALADDANSGTGGQMDPMKRKIQ